MDGQGIKLERIAHEALIANFYALFDNAALGSYLGDPDSHVAEVVSVGVGLRGVDPSHHLFASHGEYQHIVRWDSESHLSSSAMSAFFLRRVLKTSRSTLDASI